MASLDIFHNDAFQLSELTKAIIDIPRVPTRLGNEELFEEYGISKTSMMIERIGSGLKLVPVAPRGGLGQSLGRERRQLVHVSAVHLPQRDTILADEVQNVRAFGSETEMEGVQQLIQRQLQVMKGNIDLTLEHMRVGALKGKVVDADGASVLWDLYDIFGMQRTKIGYDIENPKTTVDLRQKTEDTKRAIQKKLGGKTFGRVRVKCSESWFDKFVSHDKMYKAWELYQQGDFARSHPGQGFAFNGIFFEVYHGGTDAGDFFEPDTAWAYPEGVRGMFQIAYAPGDYMDTVNRIGLPYYANQKIMDYNKGVMLEAQSNPIVLNTLPEAVIELSAGK